MIGRPRRREAAAVGHISGSARIDRRTKNLIGRLQPGDVAVIDHADLDRIAAEGLIQRQVAAVVNASKSMTGRYPNLGPLLLCSAGIPILDDAGAQVLRIPEGAKVVIDDDRLYVASGNGDRRQIARGERLTLGSVEDALDVAKHGLATELERFAENTIEYIRDERDVLIEAARLPDTLTDFSGRHVLIVVRGYSYKEDLSALRAYIKEVNPVLVGVDGGADALIEFGLTPDVIIGDMDSVTTKALVSGAEVIVHAYQGGHAPGMERLQALGIPSVLFEAPGTSEDIAMLMAFEHGAELIVAVGTHANLIEFLDKGRKGMASTFLTRLRVGPILVDAKGVSRLYRSTIKRRDLFLLIAAAFLALAIAVWLSEPMRLYVRLIWIDVKNLWFEIKTALFG